MGDKPEPVHAWWEPINKQHTFHFAPAWSIHGKCEVECAGDRVFWAWRHQKDGMQPVYIWWDDKNKQHTFHLDTDGPWTHGGVDEAKAAVAFYAYPDEASAPEGACAVHAFWDAANQQHNFHCGEAWNNGETSAETGQNLYYVMPKGWNPDMANEHDGHDHEGGGGGEVMERTIGLQLDSEDGSLTDEAKQTFLTDCNSVIQAETSEQKHCSCKDASVQNEGILEVTFEGPQECLDDLAMKATWDSMDTEAMKIVGDMMMKQLLHLSLILLMLAVPGPKKLLKAFLGQASSLRACFDSTILLHMWKWLTPKCLATIRLYAIALWLSMRKFCLKYWSP